MRKRVLRTYRHKANVLKEYIEKNKKIITLFLLIFTIGFVIGCINSARLLPEEKSEATSYIMLFTDSIKTKDIDLGLLIKDAIFGNIKQVFYPWIMGLIVIGIPLIFIYIALEGYMLGFTVTSVISSLGVIKGCTFLVSSVITKQIVFIPLMFIISINAMVFSNKLLKSGNINLTKEFYKYFLIFLIALIVAIGIALFEVYIGFPLTKLMIKIFVP